MDEERVKRSVGRYSIHREIASGGMATVYLGRLNAAGGVGRIVAIKRLHEKMSRDPDFVSMFLDEARLAARIHHPNVVPTLDVLADSGELFVVMEYVRGESLAKLRRAARAAKEPFPVPVVASIMSGVLQGLHAAHDAVDERGEPLGIVHRDVSPQNIIVGQDGSARVLDFGVAKAASRLHQTQDGQLKGKLAYMAPEQISDQEVTKLCDIYAAGIVLWEALADKYLFRGKTDGETLSRILDRTITPPSQFNEAVTPELDAVVLQALEVDPAKRFTTAREMAQTIDAAVRTASVLEVGAWVERMAEEALKARLAAVRDIESGCADSLSGFPSLPASYIDELAPASASSSEAKGQLATAVTVTSQTRPTIEAPKPRRWPLLLVVLLVVGATGWLVVSGRVAGWLGKTEPASAETSQTTAAETATAPEPTAPEPTSEPTGETTTATASDEATSSATADAPASATPPSPPPRPRPTTRPKPPPPQGDGKDPNDIDSLIETRK